MVELDYALIDGKFEFNCELSDVVVFVEDVSFNWSFILWSLFGIVVVGLAVATSVILLVRNKKNNKKY